MKVHWSARAEQDLDRIHDFIALDSPLYAIRTVDRMTARSRQIAAFPHSGRRVPGFDDTDLREVFVGPYRIIYRIDPDSILVVTVVHGARSIPDRFDSDSNFRKT